MSAFWDDLRKDMQDPEFAAVYAAETADIERADTLSRMEDLRKANLLGSVTVGSRRSLDMLGPGVRREGTSFDVDIPDEK